MRISVSLMSEGKSGKGRCVSSHAAVPIGGTVSSGAMLAGRMHVATIRAWSSCWRWKAQRHSAFEPTGFSAR